MAVYVDDMFKYPMGRFGRLKMSHMIADTDAELHEMADAIGVARKWHQAPPDHDSHYDIALTKRARAIEYGAVEITLRQCGAMSFRLRITGVFGSPADANDWLKYYWMARDIDKAAA